MSELIDIERADYLVSSGRYGTLTLGPFAFSVNTADGGSIGFEVTAGRWSWSWAVVREPHVLDNFLPAPSSKQVAQPGGDE